MIVVSAMSAQVSKVSNVSSAADFGQAFDSSLSCK